MKTKRYTILALLTTIAIIFGYVEFLFPLPVPIPGIKPGLSNIVIMLCLYGFGFKTAGIVMILKVVLTFMLFQTPLTFVYSLSGAVVSLIVMSALKKFNFNIICVSIGGAVFHNIAQLITASLILKNINVLYYIFVLIIAGIIFGILTGLITKIIYKRVIYLIKKY